MSIEHGNCGGTEIKTLTVNGSMRILVLAPHPDDEALAAGGLLQEAVRTGAEVLVVYATDGENNPWPQRVLERRWHVGSAERRRWGARRRGEALAALKRLGVSSERVRHLGWPDQGVTRMLMRNPASLTRQIEAGVQAFAPTHIVAPSLQDRHPDHNALGVLALLTRDRATASGQKIQLLRYVVHGRFEVPAEQSVCVPLSPAEVVRKREAIKCHRTQVALSRRRFLSYARPREAFLLHDPEAPLLLNHLVRRVDVDRTHVTLEIDEDRLPHAPGGSRLLLLCCCPGGDFVSVLGPLNQPRSQATFVDLLSGRHVAEIVRHKDRRVRCLRLAHNCAPEMPTAIFVKCQARTVLFDRAGWRASRAGTDSQTQPAGDHLVTINELRPLPAKFR